MHKPKKPLVEPFGKMLYNSRQMQHELRKRTMTFKLTVKNEDAQISLEISNFRPENGELINVRLDEVMTLLSEIVSSDEAASKLSDVELTRLQPGLAALELKYKILVHQATQQATAAKSIAEGRDTISQHGFPEFDDV
jgi:hypothetical protein